MRGLISRSLVAMVATACAAVPFAAAPAAAQTSYSPYAETAAAALSRYVRTLASEPRDFSALIGAGRAALAVGDEDAAAGFFARANDINTNSPLPHAGMGAVSVMKGEPYASLPYFTRAQQLGAPLATFSTDRGLAYDLLGRQADAQNDYRAALGGLDSDEARRRLALSLAISGKRDEALLYLVPLQKKGDSAAYRVRAFVLALTGDSNGAMMAIETAMPGSRSGIAPFLASLPGLSPAQKAAAVNLGIFPTGSGVAMANAAPPAPAQAAPPAAQPRASSGDRLASIDFSLRQPTQPATRQPATTPARRAPATAQAASRQTTPTKQRKIWLQLASGPNSSALPAEYSQIKSKNRKILDGIRGYVVQGSDRARLIIGPFRNSRDAETFALGLASVNAFRWTNSETDTIVPLETN